MVVEWESFGWRNNHLRKEPFVEDLGSVPMFLYSWELRARLPLHLFTMFVRNCLVAMLPHKFPE